MKSDFVLRTLKNTDGSSTLAVIYDGEYIFEEKTSVLLEDSEGKCFHGTISSEDTSALFGPLSADTLYRLSLDGARCMQTSIQVNNDGSTFKFPQPLPDEIRADITSVAPRAAAAVTYTVHASASSASVGSFPSLFKAIEKARTTGSGAVVKLSGSEVYRHQQAGRLYKYQFTAAYGYIQSTDTSGINSWLNGYLYTYLINSSDATVYGCNYKMGKGTPNAWALEPNSGGYYYQYNVAGSTYRKIAKNVLLTQARFKPSQGTMSFNAYIFCTYQNSNISVDLGIMSDGNGQWKPCTYSAKAGGGVQTGPVICTSTLNSNGEYVADSDVEITVSYVNGKIDLSVKRLKNGAVTTLSVSHAAITSASNPCLVSSVSYVPDRNGKTPDFRCDGYLKNVIQTESKLYNTAGTATNFYSTSSTTQYSLCYNTDCCTLTTGTNKDTIDIFYDRAYRT